MSEKFQDGKPMDLKLPEIHNSQLLYGKTAHTITLIAFVVSVTAPVLILMFPQSCFLNPNLIFNAIFEGKNPKDIWMVSGTPLQPGSFWKLFLKRLFTPDGYATFGIALGSSISLWGYMVAAWQFGKKKEYFFLGVSLFLLAMILLSMSGIINMQ